MKSLSIQMKRKYTWYILNWGADFFFLLRIFSNPYVCAVDSVHGVVGLNIFSYVT